MRTYLITGASSGLGASLARAVLARGDRAVLTARRTQRLQEIAAEHGGRALVLPLDVTDGGARQKTVDTAIDHFGAIDALANVAGRGSLGAAEEVPEDMLRAQFELNFFAAAEMTRAVLPHMRARGRGHILQVTSIGGMIGVGGGSTYCSSKFALEGWSEAIAGELAPLGIRVTIVEPGSFRTEFSGEINLRPPVRIEDYRSVTEALETRSNARHGVQPGDPDRAAQAMIAVVESDSPPLRLLLGEDALQGWQVKRDSVQRDVDAWRQISLSTVYPGETTPLLF